MLALSLAKNISAKKTCWDYRMARTHMSYIYRSFSKKEPCTEWLFCGKWCATLGILWVFANPVHKRPAECTLQIPLRTIDYTLQKRPTTYETHHLHIHVLSGQKWFHCNTLQNTAKHCHTNTYASAMTVSTHFNTLQHTATHCSTLQHTAIYCNALPPTHVCVCHDCFDTLQHTTTHCNTLQQTATHGNTLQHTATHCNTLHHTATHCNTLQHTATHFSPLLRGQDWFRGNTTLRHTFST